MRYSARTVKVPLLDLKPQYRALKAELDAAILRVSESQHFILGPEEARDYGVVDEVVASRVLVGVPRPVELRPQEPAETTRV